MSVSIGRTHNYDLIEDYKNMTYQPLSFEDDLFIARVYKRNYRSPANQEVLKRQFGRDIDFDTASELVLKSRQSQSIPMKTTVSTFPHIVKLA